MKLQLSKLKPDRWSLPSLLICGVVLTPVAVICGYVLLPGDDVWQHLVRTQLRDLVEHSFFLLAGTLTGTFCLGTSMAWFATVYEFPGRRCFEWAAVLPFAFPTYVLGYVFMDLFDKTGPIQGVWRYFTGAAPAWFPQIQSGWGVLLVMILAFYPYVYILSRTAFQGFGKRSLEVAQSLGYPPVSAFFRLTLPLARPWIFGGLLLVSMETLADFGTVSVFNYDTFTTAIYKAWFSLFSLRTAAQLSALLLSLAVVLLALEKYFQRRKRYYGLSPHPPSRVVLKGWRAALVSLAFFSVIGLGFLLPMSHLIYWAASSFRDEADVQYWILVGHTLSMGLAAALFIGFCALFLAYGARFSKSSWAGGGAVLATVGYALPGTVLALGVYLPMVWLDQLLAENIFPLLGIESGLLLTGTLMVMMLGYTVRFLGVAYPATGASLERIRPAMDEVARSLGHGRLSILRKIHLPLLRPGLLTAMLLVLIDVMKEMPITLMTRPFQWDTLSTRIFELTSEGEYERAALPSILLVLAGLMPVMLLIKASGRERR